MEWPATAAIRLINMQLNGWLMMNKLSWFDRLLLKVAVAKALARNFDEISNGLAQAKAAFDEINSWPAPMCGSDKPNPGQ